MIIQKQNLKVLNNLWRNKDGMTQQNLKKAEDDYKTALGQRTAKLQEIEELKDYVTTEEFEKEIAEDKLGLVDPDEIIFKPVK